MFFDAFADLVITVQSLIKKGWIFEFEQGERKFASSKLLARKGDKTRHGYESEGVEGFLESLCQEEMREYEDKMLAWFRDAPRGPKNQPCCLKCNREADINRYSCPCGWEL